ncbi:MAG: CPBP family intramembrane glutamic endopeptidase [Acidimicrobiia bacterium]
MQSDSGRDVSALGLFALWLAYTVVSIGLWRLVPTIAGWDVASYTDLAATTESLVQNITIAQGITAGLVVLLVAVLGWQTAVLKDEFPTPRWLLAVPIIIGIMVLATADWSNLVDQGTDYVLALSITTLFIGISEETMFRGVFVVGVRRLGKNEMHVWFWSTLAFAFIHAGNAFVGGGVGVVTQVVLAFFGGTLFYITRRATGTLLAPILLHALWDFSVFSHTGDLRAISTVTTQVLMLTGVILFVVVMIKRHDWANTNAADLT